MNLTILSFSLHRNELLRVRNKEQLHGVAAMEAPSPLNVESFSPGRTVHSQLKCIEVDEDALNHQKIEEKICQKGTQQQQRLSSKVNREQVNVCDQLEHNFHQQAFHDTGTNVTAGKDAEPLPPTAPPPLNMPIVASKKISTSSG